MKQKDYEQMAREVKGYMVNSGAGFWEVLDDFGAGFLTRMQSNKLEDVFCKMGREGKLDNITGVQ